MFRLALAFTTDCLADQRGVSKEEVKSWTPHPGGAPANVATGAARLGAHAAFVGALGGDALGDRFASLLQARSVDMVGVQRIAGRATRDVLVTLTEDGDRTFAAFGSTNAEYADCFLDADALPRDLLASADVLVTGTLGLAYPGSGAAIRRAVETARSGGRAAIIVDVNWRPVFWEDAAPTARDIILDYIEQAHLLKVTDEEAEWLLDVPRDEALTNPEKVLARAPFLRGVLVSAGEKGCAYAFAAPGAKTDITGIVPVFNVRVSDTTGAGDAFLSGFIFDMMRQGGLDALVADPEKVRHAVVFASACGALTCTRPGAIDSQPELDEAEKLAAAADKAQA